MGKPAPIEDAKGKKEKPLTIKEVFDINFFELKNTEEYDISLPGSKSRNFKKMDRGSHG